MINEFPTETAEEFARGYAERSGYDLDQLLTVRQVVRCWCDDYEDCTGWTMVPKDSDVRDA